MIPPVVFPKYRKTEILPTKLIAKVEQPYSFLELALFSVSHSPVLCFSVGVGVAGMTLLGSSLGSAVAQMPPAPGQTPLGERTMSQVNVLFVNPSIGNDIAGNGGESTPLKTITQALQKATPNTVITLSTGTYSAETGEVFPLILRPGVSIQGDAKTQGKDITIQGGGSYLSRSFGGQNVTIVGANQAGVTGVTVTNSNPRGYGLWLESGKMVISQNTFTGSTQDGVFVTGNAAPTISQNNFNRNRANGITLAGNSQAQVRENVFYQTGFGINIAQNAAPVITSNQIQQNRSGILVQANAHPVLRNNAIEGSQEDGVVAIAQAMPDLGNAFEPGNNQFRNNARYDINANAAKQMISASGNTLASNRVTGKVDIKAQSTLVTQRFSPTSVRSGGPEEMPVNGEIVFSAPGLSETPNGLSPSFPGNNNSPHNITTGKLNTQLMPLHPANTSRLAPRLNPPPPPTSTPTSSVAGFPVPSSLPGRAIRVGNPVPPQPRLAPAPGNLPDLPQLNYVQVETRTIEFASPQPPFNSVPKPPASSARGKRQPSSRRQAAPVANSNLLPVPNTIIPMGNTRNMRKVPVAQSYSTRAYGGSSPYAGATPMGVRYRVLIEVVSPRDQELVRYLVPGSFSTVARGRSFMQAGVFNSRDNADAMLRTLNSNGFRGIVEPLN
ncbi:MAG: DUF1565 domain-containing protein [Mojavia pulchra JT2-VF2]|uniref:DUF1565 domain-containing protein n=1 Tax=Mojavia pulchra JT2-VF2 TaxID=287848 RepID=A0A951Q0T7_9NOST|nr:DUF1565 domain-containing protein [Mojavia pulchra JT2-VF2]